MLHNVSSRLFLKMKAGVVILVSSLKTSFVVPRLMDKDVNRRKVKEDKPADDVDKED